MELYGVCGALLNPLVNKRNKRNSIFYFLRITTLLNWLNLGVEILSSLNMQIFHCFLCVIDYESNDSYVTFFSPFQWHFS